MGLGRRQFVVLASLAMLTGFLWLASPSQSQAAGCDSSYPPDPDRNDKWEVKWEVEDWLTYHNIMRTTDQNTNLDKTFFKDPANFPIGPYQWLVKGKHRDNSGRIICFTETWTIAKVVTAANRDLGSVSGYNQREFRGLTENISKLPRGNTPYAQTAINATDTWPDIYSSRSTVLARNIRDNDNNDSAFSGPNQNQLWSPLGLYGVFPTDKDSLDETHGYQPVEWRVDGDIVDIY